MGLHVLSDLFDLSCFFTFIYINVWRSVLPGAVYFNDQSINVLFQHY